jgi:hypothetical protein
MDFDALPMHEATSDTPLELCALPRLWGAHRRLVSCFGTGHLQTELRLAALAGAEQSAFLPARPAAGATAHLVEIWCDMLGLEWPLPAADWPVPFEWRRWGEPLHRQTASPALLHIGAGSPAKCWPPERFAELARELRDTGLSPVALVGPVERERGLASLPGADAVAQPDTLEALAGLIANCEVFVGNDSGPAHLAAAIGVPTVALFGPSSPVHFRPLGRRVQVVSAASMADIAVADVLAAVSTARTARL